MSTMRITDGTPLFDTSGVTPPSPTTLNGAVSSSVTSFTFTSGTYVKNGAYVTVQAEGGNTAETVLIVSGTGVTRVVTREQLSTTASAHGNGATVTVPGSITYTLLQNTLVPNQVVHPAKITTDINYVKLVPGGTNYFPGGVTELLLIDTSAAKGQSVIKFPAFGDLLLVTSGAGSGAGSGAPGPPGPAGTATPPAPNILSATVIVGFTPNGNAPSRVNFSGVITLPVSNPNYSHLSQITLIAQDPDGNQYFVADISSSAWSGSTVTYTGITSALQPVANQTWTLTFVSINEAGAPTNPPFVNSSVAVATVTVTVTAYDLDLPWRADDNTLRKIIQIVPVIPSGQYPVNVTVWIDFADGNGPQCQGWWAVTSGGWSVNLGQPGSGAGWMRVAPRAGRSPAGWNVESEVIPRRYTHGITRSSSL